jgi:hypothetical protein
LISSLFHESFSCMHEGRATFSDNPAAKAVQTLNPDWTLPVYIWTAWNLELYTLTCGTEQARVPGSNLQHWAMYSSPPVYHGPQNSRSKCSSHPLVDPIPWSPGGRCPDLPIQHLPVVLPWPTQHLRQAPHKPSWSLG